MMMFDIQTFYYLIAALGASWSVAWFLNTRIDSIKQALIGKLEYHERYDDRRFEQINNNIWELRITNALHGVNGIKKTTRQTTKDTVGRLFAEEESGGI